MQDIHVFTSAACNYVPKVRTLIDSIRRHHPTWRVHLALADELPPDVSMASERIDEVHPVADLGIPDWLGWSFCHNIVELSTAIKPFLLMRLLSRPGCKGVVYLDPDTVLFSPLTEVEAALERASVALTPHLVDPEQTVDAVMDNEIAALKHGTYNLGFLAVAPTGEGMRFAQWWADRIYRFCRADIPNGLFTDQRWVDLAPAMFADVAILRSRRLNVATWNVTTRRVSGVVPDSVQVDGRPLGFYHFTGFDSGAHNAMAWKHAGDQPAVAELIRWYQAQMAKSEDDPLCNVPWAFGAFDDGTQIPKALRVLYRDRIDLQRAFPDPFDTGGGGLKAWWETQGRVEHPGLFDPATHDAALLALGRHLTQGFVGSGAPPVPVRGLRDRLRRAVGDSAYREQVIARLWGALKGQGLAGVVKTLRRPS